MKILLVEDEQELSDAIAHALRSRGYTVDPVEDGKMALERITLYKDDYDLVILDLMLPSMNGQEICREMRQRHIATPVIILTARDEIDTKVTMLKGGADDYLSKPFAFEELEARVSALLRRPADVSYVELKYGDLVLSPGERAVSVSGKELKLTLKEYSILEYFLRNSDRVINREEFLNHLWDFNYTSFFSNTLDVHIKNLRKKLESSRSSARIETIRGVGYKLATV